MMRFSFSSFLFWFSWYPSTPLYRPLISDKGRVLRGCGSTQLFSELSRARLLTWGTALCRLGLVSPAPCFVRSLRCLLGDFLDYLGSTDRWLCDGWYHPSSSSSYYDLLIINFAIPHHIHTPSTIREHWNCPGKPNQLYYTVYPCIHYLLSFALFSYYTLR